MQMFEHVDAWWMRPKRLPSASCLAMRSCSSRAFFSSSSILLSSAAIGFRLSERKETHIDCRGKLKRGNSHITGGTCKLLTEISVGYELRTFSLWGYTVPPCCWVLNMCAQWLRITHHISFCRRWSQRSKLNIWPSVKEWKKLINTSRTVTAKSSYILSHSGERMFL